MFQYSVVTKLNLVPKTCSNVGYIASLITFIVIHTFIWGMLGYSVDSTIILLRMFPVRPRCPIFYPGYTGQRVSSIIASATGGAVLCQFNRCMYVIAVVLYTISAFFDILTVFFWWVIQRPVSSFVPVFIDMSHRCCRHDPQLRLFQQTEGKYRSLLSCVWLITPRDVSATVDLVDARKAVMGMCTHSTPLTTWK